MTLIFELPQHNVSESKRPSAQAIYELLTSAILSGEIAPGCKLPPTRMSGQRFGLSRSTMVAIYERLATEDLIEARQGSGTFVTQRPEGGRSHGRQGDKPLPPPWLAQAFDHKLGTPRPGAPYLGAEVEIDLRAGAVDPQMFPFDKFRRSMAKALRQMERAATSYRLEEAGQSDHRLRRAIVDHSTLMRALVCDPDHILVTSGAQQALDLLARTLVEPGKTVIALEDPSFGPVIEPFISARARIRRVPVDSEGMVVDAIPDDVKLICVSPSSQYPLGVTMSPNRRQQLAAFAEDRNALIIENDYGGEIRTNGDPLKTLFGHNSSLTFYVGTFSTCMFPSFRLGFLIAPEWAVDLLSRAKRHADWQSSSVVQAAAASFINDGYLSAHIAKIRTVYKERKAAVVEAVNANFGEFLRPVPSAYGLHLAALGNPSIDWRSVANRAKQEGIQINSLADYYSHAPKQGLVFGVGVESEERLRTAISRLATLI